MPVSNWLIDTRKIEINFRDIKNILEKRDNTIFVSWTQAALDEVNANAERSLLKKFSACEDGFMSAKVAGIYAFWIAKLKPMFTIITNFTAINEYAGIATGIGYIWERIGVRIRLERNEIVDICETLRYHTSSPHAMMHIFSLWIERENLRTGLRK